MRECEVHNKTICFLNDNSSNIKKAIVSMVPDIKSSFVNSLQLCNNKGLGEKIIKQVFVTALSIVSHFKHSSISTKAL